MRAATPEEREQARLHQLLHQGNDNDVAFYLRACGGSRDVLELGCGGGRVLSRLADAGHRVTGLDDHAGMLDEASRRVADLDEATRARVRLVQGCMSRFSLGTHFDRILIPYNGLLCLLDDRHVLDCLRCVRLHLGEGGELWLDVYGPPELGDEEAKSIAAASGETSHHLVTLHEGGTRIEVFERDLWDPRAQRVDAEYSFTILAPGAKPRTVRQTIPQRYLYADQLEAMILEAGLEVSGLWGDFEGGPADADAEHIVVRARTAGGAR